MVAVVVVVEVEEVGGNKNRFVNSISERRWETAKSGERERKERAGESTLPPSAIAAAAN